jgi:hypothetical protein
VGNQFHTAGVLSPRIGGMNRREIVEMVVVKMPLILPGKQFLITSL